MSLFKDSENFFNFQKDQLMHFVVLDKESHKKNHFVDILTEIKFFFDSAELFLKDNISCKRSFQ